MQLDDSQFINKLKSILPEDAVLPEVSTPIVSDENPDWAGSTEEHKQFLRMQIVNPSPIVEGITDDVRKKFNDQAVINYIDAEVAMLKDSLGIDKLMVNSLNACAVEPVVNKEIYSVIAKNMPEINSKIKLFCRSDSQTTRRMITPIMLNSTNSPYRVLRQMLAQIENLKASITGNIVKVNTAKEEIIKERERYEKEFLDSKLAPVDPNNPPTTDQAVVRHKLEIKREVLEDKEMQLNAGIYQTYPYLASAIRELYSLVEAYNEIRINKGIPENWDELDFEREEINANVGLAVRNGIRDFISTGRVSGSSLELFESFGISPFEAFSEIAKFVTSSQNKTYTYEEYQFFIDDFVDRYKEHYKKALVRLGLNSNFLEKGSSRFLTI